MRTHDSSAKQQEDTSGSQQHIVRANRFFVVVLWFLFLVSLGMAQWHGTWTDVLLVGLPAALLPTILMIVVPHILLTRMVVGAAFMVFCALNIHQAHGMIEMHFGIFALLALLLCYEDWQVIVGAATVIAVHHLLFNYLQAAGYGLMCMPHPSLNLVFVHAAYVVVESAGLCYLAIVLRRKTLNTARSQAALEAHLNSMQIVIAQANVGIDLVATASRNVASSSEEIASGAQKQAASLEQTSASLEQITSTMRQSSEHAREANRLAQTTGESAEQGGTVVSDAVKAMQEISVASAKIADIISTINEIAFQTNLLAVNAAVEAARAGEEGRGFAVVASEVRSLALRTADAAKEIRNLIQDSLQKVERGTELVNRSGLTLDAIVTSVKRVRDIVGEMATASEEQSIGIEQVNQAMGQMDQVTQANSEKTEELASTAQSLSEQSAQLMTLVGSLT